MQKLTTKEDVSDLIYTATASAALGAAIETGLLWLLAEAPMPANSVVQTLDIPGKRGYYWLQLLENIGILEDTPNGYITSALARAAILDIHSQESWQHLALDERERSAGVQNLALYIREPGSIWAAMNLTEPRDYVEKMKANPARAREFTRTLFELHQPMANQLAALLDLGSTSRMMDLGGGSGVASFALLRKYPNLTSTVIDIENVCLAGREIAAEQSLSERISYHPADFMTGEIPAGFDLILQCDNATYWLALYQKLWKALNPGGRLVVVGKFSPDENHPPATRLLWTFLDSLEDPNNYVPTVDQLKSQLNQAGFDVAPGSHTLGSSWTVVQASKRA